MGMNSVLPILRRLIIYVRIGTSLPGSLRLGYFKIRRYPWRAGVGLLNGHRLSLAQEC